MSSSTSSLVEITRKARAARDDRTRYLIQTLANWLCHKAEAAHATYPDNHLFQIEEYGLPGCRIMDLPVYWSGPDPCPDDIGIPAIMLLRGPKQGGILPGGKTAMQVASDLIGNGKFHTRFNRSRRTLAVYVQFL